MRKDKLVCNSLPQSCWLVLLVAFACQAALSQSVKLVVRNATIMTMADGQKTPIAGYLSVDADGKILAVSAGEPPANLPGATVVDAHGDYMIPGFISAHSHLYEAAYRALGVDKPLRGWGAARQPYQRKSTADDIYRFTLYGALDHVQHGITGVYNFAVSRSANATSDPVVNSEEAFQKVQFKAEMDSGIRFEHSYPIGDTTTLAGLELTRTRIKAFLAWTATQTSPTFLKVMLSGSTGGGQSAGAAALMKEFHLGNQTHFLEPNADQGVQRLNFRAMLDTGLLQHDLYFGHFIHADDYIAEQTAKAGAGMSWQPLSNGRLASGVADIPKYLKLGIRVGMGLDGEASADLADPFENMRTGLYAVRDKYEDATVLSPYQVLYLHTMGSADVMLVKDKVGSLEPGKFADFVLVNQARLGVPLEDPYANLVFVASEKDMDSVWIGGQMVVDHGELRHYDLVKIAADAYARVAAQK